MGVPCAGVSTGTHRKSLQRIVKTTQSLDAAHRCWSSVLRLFQGLDLKSLRHPLRARSQEHHTIDRLEEAEKEKMAREEALNGLERSEKGLSSTGTTGKLFQRQHWGTILRDEAERIKVFLSV